MLNINFDELKDLAKYHFDDSLDALKSMVGIDDSEKATDAYKHELGNESITSLFPYLGWDSDTNTFILDDGDSTQKVDRKSRKYSMGFCLEFTPQIGADDSMETILQSLFIQSPPGTAFSFHLYASPNILPRLKELSRRCYQDNELGIKPNPDSNRNTNIFQVLSRKRIDWYLNSTSKSLFGDGLNLLSRDFRGIVSVNLNLDPNSDKDKLTAVSIKEQVKSTLKSANLPCVEWKPKDLINFISDFLDYTRWQHIPSRVEKEYESHTPIRRQLSSREVGVTVRPNSIDLTNDMGGDEACITQLSVSQYPSYFHMAMMAALVGDQFDDSLSYPCPYMITTTAVTQDYDAMRNKANIKVATSMRKAESWSAKIDTRIQPELQEWKAAQKAIEDGGTLIKMSTAITLLTRKEDASRARSNVISIWRSKGFKLTVDKYQQLVGFLASMPMAVSKNFYSDLQKTHRFGTKYSSNAISMSPLVAEWKGTETPVLSFIGRRGQLMTLDLFDNGDGNYNFCIVGASGSGKSFFTQELLKTYLANKAIVWVIDVGRSYENLCDLLDGDFIEFTEDTDLCLNPFTSIVDLDLDEEMGMLKSLVAQMMSPKHDMSAWHISTIEMAIRDVYATKGNDMTITDLSYYLENYALAHNISDPRYLDMSRQLFAWTRDGAYGKYFDGKANVDFTNNFTVLELDALKSKKELLSVVLMIMMHRITSAMFFSRDTKKICMIDEAWQIIQGGSHAVEFLENGYRTARKFDGAFGTATQNYLDYFKTPASEASYQNADWTFTLRQKEDSIEALAERKLMGIHNNPYKKKVLGSLKKLDNMFSEVYVECAGNGGVGRLVVDPYTAILYSSKAAHFSSIKKYKQAGMNVTEAVNQTFHDFNIKVPEPIKLPSLME